MNLFVDTNDHMKKLEAEWTKRNAEEESILENVCVQ